MTKIPVSGLYKCCETMLRDHWGYIWGTAGILWTEARQKATDNEMAQKYGSRWIGHMVADCSGVMVYIWRQYGLKIAHGSNSILRRYCGKPTLSPKPGYAAFKVRNGDDYYHIGIVSANGQLVYESCGTIIGFRVSSISEWDWFAPFKDVEYTEEAEPVKDDGERVTYRAEVTTERSPLNMRSGNGTQYPIIGKLPKGSVVDVMMVYPDGWCYVDDDGDQGYVDGSYLTPLPPATAIPDAGDKIPTDDTDPPKNAKYTVLRRADGVTITLEGLWTVEE